MGYVSPWKNLVASARRNRSNRAPYFKPACLIAMVDLVDAGHIDPAEIDPELLMARLDALVANVHDGRADMRWRPIWHLSNDRAWLFTKQGRHVGHEDFGPSGKPDSLREWRASFDKIAVPIEMLPHWRSAADRLVLRREAMAMLEVDDEGCRRLARQLIVDSYPTELTSSPHRRVDVRQGFQVDAGIRQAVELRAMAVTCDWLERDGWRVADCSATESYDLLAQRGEETLFVEVKGTIGEGDSIQLTRLEVEFAQMNRKAMALAVVARIAVHGIGDEALAAGGELVVRRPWAPSAASLQPISFTCQLEDIS